MNIRQIVYASLLIALGILLPFIFHYAVPASWELGKTLSPIHYSAFFAGGFFGPYIGALVGLMTPLLSYFVTAMPQYPFFVFISIETLVYGLVFGYLYKRAHLNIYLSLFIAMVVGRIANLCALYFIGYVFIGTPQVFRLFIFLKDFLPGIVGAVFQFIIIPTVVRRVSKVLLFSNK